MERTDSATNPSGAKRRAVKAPQRIYSRSIASIAVDLHHLAQKIQAWAS